MFGAGIAGLTVAHELARRGWSVVVYEENQEVGGFFRSGRDARNMPTEYSWHGMGPWYHNVFDVLQEIPVDGSTVYVRALSRPIDFGIAPDDAPATFDDTPMVNVRGMFRFGLRDLLGWGWLMLRTWTAGRRSEEKYAAILASDAFRPVLSDRSWRTWRASFGPWVGSDWMHVSLHQVGLFYRKLLLSRPAHRHPADADGPAWTQGSRSGWLLLRGPSSEAWFDPWVAYLRGLGVTFELGKRLDRLEHADGRITGAYVDGERVDADLYVLATHPFAAADIVARTPSLSVLAPLRDLRLAFGEKIRWPRERAALVVSDSEFNLTLFADEQIFPPDADLGEGVASLWTGTACVSGVPGRVHGLPLERCTKAQFLEEVHAQLASCGGLDDMVKQANGGRSWRDFPLVAVKVWHEWTFSPAGIRGRQPKWVNTTHTQPWLPTQRTDVPNLVLAGAHTRTDADVWSIEAAVESGRRAARIVEPDVVVRTSWTPGPLRVLQRIDDALYAVGGPHVLDVVAVGVLVGGALFAGWRLWGGAPRARVAGRRSARK